MSETEFVIPGMVITREDVESVLCKVGFPESVSEKAHDIAMSLTDAQMELVADMFAQEFFDGYVGMFQEFLEEVVNTLILTDEIKVNDEPTIDSR